MSGAWYGLATLAIALVIRWFIYNDTGPSRLKPRKAKDQPQSGREPEFGG
jgi:hypothetical protein